MFSSQDYEEEEDDEDEDDDDEGGIEVEGEDSNEGSGNGDPSEAYEGDNTEVKTNTAPDRFVFSPYWLLIAPCVC